MHAMAWGGSRDAIGDPRMAFGTTIFEHDVDPCCMHVPQQFGWAYFSITEKVIRLLRRTPMILLARCAHNMSRSVAAI